jgi:SAM-dependent methyltransferase
MRDATELLDEMLPDVRGRDVLDVGCGAGWLVRRLRGAGARAVGVDPLGAALERARAEDPDGGAGRYLEAGAQTLPFADDSFDLVVFFNSLHHVPPESLDRGLAEAIRVLRRGGVVYVQEPLPRGEFFELMLPVHDETEVRAAAQEALDRAIAEGALVETASREETVAQRLADFHALRRMMVGVDPDRASAIEAHEHSLHEAFEHAGRASPGGREFEQPVLVRVLRRSGERP